MIAIISFVSSLVVFKDSPKSTPLAVVGVLLLCLGIMLLAYVSSRSSSNDQDTNTIDNKRSSSLDDKRILEDPIQPFEPPSPQLGAPLISPNAPLPPPSNSVLLGFTCVIFTGFVAGTVFIPLRLAPEHYRDGLESIKFSFSQGISTLPAALLLVPLLFGLLYVLDKDKDKQTFR